MRCGIEGDSYRSVVVGCSPAGCGNIGVRSGGILGKAFSRYAGSSVGRNSWRTCKPRLRNPGAGHSSGHEVECLETVNAGSNYRIERRVDDKVPSSSVSVRGAHAER